MGKRVVRINDIDVSEAIGFVYDGCHKIFLVYNQADIDQAKSYGYEEVLGMDVLYETYRDSCYLRFIQDLTSFRDIIPQGYARSVFVFDDDDVKVLEVGEDGIPKEKAETPGFNVRVTWPVSKTFFVEAATEDKALEIMRRRIEDGEISCWDPGWEASDDDDEPHIEISNNERG